MPPRGAERCDGHHTLSLCSGSPLPAHLLVQLSTNRVARDCRSAGNSDPNLHSLANTNSNVTNYPLIASDRETDVRFRFDLDVLTVDLYLKTLDLL